MSKNLLNYTNLVEYLRKKGYTEISEGVFIVNEDDEFEIADVLTLREGHNYKEDLSKLKKEMEEATSIVEGERKEYGILFVDNYIIFLKRFTDGLKSKVGILRKSLDKITPAFEKKFKQLLKDIGNWQYWDNLFDRSDIIEEFYKLYTKARKTLPKKIIGITDDARKEEFADDLLMQLLIIWYLQERGLLNNDPRYLVGKFKEYKHLGFANYYEFLRELFKAMMNEPNDGIYYKDDRLGKIVVTGPAPFLNFLNGDLEGINIPDEVFYVDHVTDLLKTVDPNKVKLTDVPILNLFESRDWTEGNIDEFVLGAIFEKLLTAEDRKEKGAYYTPEPITEYIGNNTIKLYFVDRINEKFATEYENLDEFFYKDTNEECYAFLFSELQNIKILDPACGSGHFLETAINVLVEIYEKIWKKAKELGFSSENFVILTANEKGEIIKEPLIAINAENERTLKLKFHIILSRNLYGVDILQSAIKVTRARMFLNLAKHFHIGTETHVRFPNVHFNLRCGNSLIGFADHSVFKRVKGQTTLEQFFATKDKEPLNIKLDKELEEYIKKMNKVIGKNVYALLCKVREHFGQKLTQDKLKQVLRLRSYLINILLVSLNTDYAIRLKKLIDEITSRFNEKLNEEYVKYLIEKGIKINEEKLRQIGYFHWIMEFSEVFLEKKGFDVIIGNPPYGNILSKIEKKICQINASFNGEIASVFVERCIGLNKNSGYLAFIITYAMTFNKKLSGTRKKIYNSFEACYISTFDRDKCKFFDNMTQSVSIMLCKRKITDSKCKYYTSRMFREMPRIDKIEYQQANEYLLGEKIGVTFSEKHRLPKIGNKLTLEILKKLVTNIYNVEEILKKGNEQIWIRTSGNYWYNAWNTKPYESSEIKSINVSEQYKDFIILLVNSSLFYLWFRIYGDGRHMNRDIMAALPIPHKKKIIYSKKILSYSSNLLMKFLFYNFDKERNRFITSNVKPIIDFCDIILGKLYGFTDEEMEYILKYDEVIRSGRMLPNLFDTLCEYALFDCQTNRNFVNYELITYLINELYYKGNHAKEGSNSEPNTNLLEIISKHIKPIKYNRWADLYWKKQLENNVTPEEEKELEKLEEENHKIIEEVYQTLSNDKEIQKEIEKIKSHQ